MSTFEYNKHFPKHDDVRSSSTNNQFVITLNGQKYILAVFLDDGESIEAIPVKELDSLMLVDNFLGFKQTGVITYSNPNYTIGRFINRIISGFTDNDKCINLNETEPKTFQFKGGELVHIKFQMVYAEDEERITTSSDLIMHTYAITNIKDTGLPFSEKKYTIEFEGIESYLLRTNKLTQYICGSSERGTLNERTIANLSDYPSNGEFTPNNLYTHRSEKTGIAMFSIMYDLYNNYTNTKKPAMKYTDLLPIVDFGSETVFLDGTVIKETNDDIVEDGETRGVSEIDNYTYKLDVNKQPNPKNLVVTDDGFNHLVDKKPSDFWDFGADDSYLYTQFDKNETALNMVMGFYKYHTSNLPNNGIDGHDPCILKLQRPVNETIRGVVTLRPLVSYFEDFGNVYSKTLASGSMGSFVFNTSEEPDNPIDGITKFTKRLLDCDDQTKISRPSKGIKDFYYDPISPLDSSNYFKSHISIYDGGDTPLWYELDGRYGNVVEYIGKNYISNVLETEFKGDYGDLFNVAGDDIKNDPNNSLQITYTNPPTLSGALAMGRNRAILSFIFLNDALNFRCDGSIARQSGLLFSASSFNNYNKDDKLKDRLFGVYFGSRVEHHINIKDKKYENVLYGVKFYKANK